MSVIDVRNPECYPHEEGLDLMDFRVTTQDSVVSPSLADLWEAHLLVAVHPLSPLDVL